MALRQGLTQEGLKCLACVSMLLDHIGLLFFPQTVWLRAIGRLAFPIYCFLLVEGFEKTRDRRQYAIRLLLGAVIAELPYDLALYGCVYWQRQNVMLTLLLGFGMLWDLEEKGKYWHIPLLALAAQMLGSDYGGHGIVLITVFWFLRDREEPWLLLVLLAVSFLGLGGGNVTVQMFGMVAAVPIWAYNGRKVTHNRVAKWGFYLFYPGHLMMLYLLSAFRIG